MGFDFWMNETILWMTLSNRPVIRGLIAFQKSKPCLCASVCHFLLSESYIVFAHKCKCHIFAAL